MLGVRAGVGVCVGVRLCEPDSDGETDCVALFDVVSEGEHDSDAVVDGDPDTDCDADDDGVASCEGDNDCVPV